jgi:hypothetical protein
MQAQQTFSIREALTFGFNTFVNNIALFLKICAVVVSAYIGSSLIVILISHTAAAPLAQSIGRVLISMINVVLGIYMAIIALALVDNKPITLSTLMEDQRIVPKAIWASFVYAALVTFGLIFLIIPGIMLAVAYYFFLYRLIDTNSTVSDAFTYSSHITAGSRWRILGYLLVGSLLTALSFSLLSPIVYVGSAYIYRTLEQHKQHEVVTTSSYN